jgi:Uma2 family endonuclease
MGWEMSQAAQLIDSTEPLEHVVMYDVSWETYEKLLEAFEERRFPHTYVDGTLEITTISHEHEWLKKILARFIENLSMELKVRITSSGSTTLRRELKKRGLEPDESYYIANYAVVRGLKRINLNRHPPPDLIVEIDVTHKSLDRLEPYAKLGVPEIWQHSDKGIRFLKRISESSYRVVKRSVFFPGVGSDDIQRFLNLAEELDEFDLVNTFVDWARGLAQANN